MYRGLRLGLLVLVVGSLVPPSVRARRLVLSCTDGDASCDADAACNGTCTFAVCTDASCTDRMTARVHLRKHGRKPSTRNVKVGRLRYMLRCLPSLPGACAGSTPTTTLPPRPQCANDAQCDDGNACNGFERCVAGVCAPGAPSVCEDGTPALWLGTATSTPGGGYVDIAATLCLAAGVLQGSYACTAGSLQCAESSGKITGTVVGSKIYPVVSFADGSFCNFGGALVGPRGNGLYACHEPSGVLTLDYGTWALTRCP